ncbi:MAG: class I SAM-dependent methyltransferase [Balneolaceae bacterium]
MTQPDQAEHRPIYSVLAHIYDTLMSDVDYELWADYVDELIQIHAPGAEKLLELACGTGSVALSLDELGYYDITATDASPAMIEKAGQKGAEAGSSVLFKPLDFLNIDLDEKFDLVFLVFDSINYLHTEADILKLHEQVKKVLKPGGYFIFDFTTPRNSRQAVGYLNNEEGISSENYRFFRTSRFDAVNNMHINEFEIEKLGADRRTVKETFVEIHRQKIYTLDQMKAILKKTGYRMIDMVDGFSFDRADNKSLRITIVCQHQKTG